MSTKQPTKRAANVDQHEKSETMAKTIKNDPAKDDTVDGGNEKVHADDQVPIGVKIEVSRKLPDKILQKFHNEPGKLLIAGNVDWETVGGSHGERNELVTFHRFTDERVSKRDEHFSLHLFLTN